MDAFILCLCTPVLVSPCASLCKRPRVSDGEGENVSWPCTSERGLAHLSVFARRFVGGSRLQVCCLTRTGDFYEDNKSKPCTPQKTKTRTWGATCIGPRDRDGLGQRNSFQVLTSSKAIKTFTQPLLQDFVILPSELLLCKSLCCCCCFNYFFKPLKLSEDCYQGKKSPARHLH